MCTLSKALLVSLLLVLLQSQASTVSQQYQLDGSTYTYVYGTGSTATSALSTRAVSDLSASTFTPDSTYTPPATGPAPATVNCPINQVYDNVLCYCVCIVGYYLKDGICVPYPNVTPTCGRNQVYQDKRCVCAQGYFLIGSLCDVCPPYSTYNLTTLSCQCATGYVLAQGECRLPFTPAPVPPQPLVPQCGVNQKLVNNICQCLPDFYVVRGVCTYCVKPNFYDTQLGLCRPTCATNQLLDLSTLKCICLSGFNNIKGQCGSCPAYSVYNKLTAQCDCVNGYVFSSGICIPKTSAPLPPAPLPVAPRDCADVNAVLIAGVCICSTSYHLIGGVCKQCALD